MKADERSDQLAYERLSQQVPELKRLLEKSERQRGIFSSPCPHLISLYVSFEISDFLKVIDVCIKQYSSKKNSRSVD